MSGSGRGFRLAVPAPAQTSTLLLYLGGRGTARLSVAAPDGRQVATDELPGTPDRPRGVVYRLHLAPGPDAGPVLVSWTSADDDPAAGVALEAAALLAG